MTRKSKRLREAEQAFIAACKAEDPKAVAAAWVRVALETPGTVEGIREALRLIPYLDANAGALRRMSVKNRRSELEWAWERRPYRDPEAELDPKLMKLVVDIAMAALG